MDNLKELNGARTLVTGGAGFIGSHIVDGLIEQDAEVIVLDDMSNGDLKNIARWEDNKRLKLIKGDIRNQETVRNAIRDVEYLFHQAARVSVPYSVRNPHLVLEVNVMGTTVLLEESRKADVEKIVVASSSSVYGDTPTLPKVETMCTNPISPYGVSKLAQEQLGKAFHETYNMNITSLRYFNVYGPRQRGGSYAGVISIFFKKAFENQALPIFGDGTSTRDFTYVEDVVQANLLAAAKPVSKGRIYNVARGEQTSIDGLTDEIIRLSSSKSKKEYLASRPGDIHDSLADLTLICRELGYDPKYGISEGLRKTFNWISNELQL
ncbi:MAG: SDR family NAD(P)-dependent oxidoreductase [Candidatus Thorarchaeota archaeon]|nr:SDR family NAD(P)-dependent oxidoreductase [Candidatus Thorarchaeota archaeon]